jgi:Fe-S-cluster containining protein
MDCSCDICKSACTHKPGWFAPGEATKAAELLGLSEQEFFDRYLGVDFWMGSPSIFVLAPATISMTPGGVYPYTPTGQCIFFKEGLCSIHAAKPRECAETDHVTSHEEFKEIKNNIVNEWKEEGNQQHITDLLGHEPTPSEPESIFDLLGFGR